MPTSILPAPPRSFLQHINLAYSSSSDNDKPFPISFFSFTRIRKRAVLGEFLGCFCFLLAINTIASSTTTSYSLIATAVGIGGTLTILIALLCSTLGGFLNPSVSFSVFLCDRATLDFSTNLVCYGWTHDWQLF
eukprot:GHVS01080155.1.p1 GENE.GHVS01080155.1~~GHVS01080155.1.p1  ORF type:complete len:134 (-),score=16.37 GHVS01080155.1:250-651(-)